MHNTTHTQTYAPCVTLADATNKYASIRYKTLVHAVPHAPRQANAIAGNGKKTNEHGKEGRKEGDEVNRRSV